jgi:hypothetical protein
VERVRETRHSARLEAFILDTPDSPARITAHIGITENRSLRRIMDALNPIEWFSWLYGKTGNAGFFVVVLLAVVFVSFLWSKSVDEYKKKRNASSTKSN